MKGIALSTIALFLIAIVSIVVLISFIGGNMPQALKSGYCSMIRGLIGLLPLPESLKPSLPLYCEPFSVVQQMYYTESSNPDRISFDIAAYVMACWEKTGSINMGQDTNCYEIVIKRIDGIVNGDIIKSQLPEKYKGILGWQAGDVATPKSIGIFYNATQKLIVVI